MFFDGVGIYAAGVVAFLLGFGLGAFVVWIF